MDNPNPASKRKWELSHLLELKPDLSCLFILAFLIREDWLVKQFIEQFNTSLFLPFRFRNYLDLLMRLTSLHGLRSETKKRELWLYSRLKRCWGMEKSGGTLKKIEEIISKIVKI